MKKLKLFVPILMAAVIAPWAQAADVDWSQVSTKDVKVFYPGVASWDFLLSGDHGAGANRVRSMQKACADCHVGESGEYDVQADKIITGELEKSESGEPFEPNPVMDGMPGFKDVKVQVAYDAANIYVRLQWQGSGASVEDPTLADKDKEDRVSLQIANQIKTFSNYGCFITCHDDEEGMPNDRGNDTKLYAYYTHAGEKIAPPARLQSHISKQQFMDLWIAGFKGKDVETTDEYILESRTKDNDDLKATGSFENGTYTVVMTRALSTGDDKDIQLSDGGVFSFGVAVHDGGHGERHHYVSFPVSVGLSTAADITAKKL